MKLTKTILFMISFLFVTGRIIIADEIGLVAAVDRNVLTLEDTFNLTIAVTGDTNSPQPSLPDLKGFHLIYGPNFSTRTSIINGVVSVSKSYIYVLKPAATGKFTIGESILNYKGMVYKSNTIDIEVVDKANAAQRQKESNEIDLESRVFIEFFVDKEETYTYEQIILTFRLFYQRGLPIDDLEYEEPEIRNFIKESLGDQKQYEVVRNGMIYSVVELKKALFPVVSGEIKLDPAKLHCSLILRSNRMGARKDLFEDTFFDDFFGRNQQKYPLTRTSNPITLRIKPLPEQGKPDNFSGAVGNFSFNVEAAPTNVKVGDPITLTMRINGNGNLQSISEPSLKFVDKNNFKTYPPETKTNITRTDNGIKGEKLFSKVIEPQNADITHTPDVSFSFFNPESGKYQTILADPLPVNVEAAEHEEHLRLYVRDAEANKDQAAILTKDILPIMANLASFSNQGRFLYKSPLMLFVIIIPIIGIVVSLYTQNHKKRLKTDVSYARNRRAQKVARKRLAEARKLTDHALYEKFYSVLSSTVSEYLADKLNTTSASIDTKSAPELLEKYNIPKEAINKLTGLFDLCDYGRFSKDSGTKEMIHVAFNNAVELINLLEKEIKR